MPQIFCPPKKSKDKVTIIKKHALNPLNVSGKGYNRNTTKGKLMEMIYLVINDKGYLEMMYDNEQSAKDYIALEGNENYRIDSEEMC
jgi:hypothetical protein